MLKQFASDLDNSSVIVRKLETQKPAHLIPSGRSKEPISCFGMENTLDHRFHDASLYVQWTTHTCVVLLQ